MSIITMQENWIPTKQNIKFTIKYGDELGSKSYIGPLFVL